MTRPAPPQVCTTTGMEYIIVVEIVRGGNYRRARMLHNSEIEYVDPRKVWYLPDAYDTQEAKEL